MRKLEQLNRKLLTIKEERDRLREELDHKITMWGIVVVGVLGFLIILIEKIGFIVVR